MSKKIIRIKGLSFYPDDTIPKLIEELQNALDKGYTHVEADYFGDDKEFYFYTERLETNEEYRKRIKEEKERADLLKRRELAEFARLKAKYGA